MNPIRLQTDKVTIYCGKAEEIADFLPPHDACVTDPPYGLSFMGKKWDYQVPTADQWSAIRASLRPGAHLLSFAGARTQHRMAVNIEDAGFEIRDMLAWVYGSGFPKSLDVSKAIDKAAGAEREVVGKYTPPDGKERPNSFRSTGGCYGEHKGAYQTPITAPATPEAQQWQGWGTALKPALEPITMARNPFKGAVADNVLSYGTGALNIDGCRVALSPDEDVEKLNARSGGKRGFDKGGYVGGTGDKPLASGCDLSKGRFPANLIHDGSDEVVGLFPETKSGNRKAGDYGVAGSSQVYGARGVKPMPQVVGDSGSAARFFYCAKASRKERGEGNIHPTVKPIELMRYLCRLVTPPEGTILDPFAGSGTTAIAAIREGFRVVLIEQDPHHCDIAVERVKRELGIS